MVKEGNMSMVAGAEGAGPSMRRVAPPPGFEDAKQVHADPYVVEWWNFAGLHAYAHEQAPVSCLRHPVCLREHPRATITDMEALHRLDHDPVAATISVIPRHMIRGAVA